jgi:hypothetical protein
MEFLNPKTVFEFRALLKLELKREGIRVEGGSRQLTAKVFGYDTYNEMVAHAGHGNPSAPDWNVSPEELDRRGIEYLNVLRRFGIEDELSIELFSRVTYGGWWGLSKDEWLQEVRQGQRVDRITSIGRSRWRPIRTFSIARRR